MCLRPHSAGSTIPRLRPTGSSLGIAPVDYDPVVLLKPFGPRLAAGALPSRASSMVAPGRPIRVPAFAVVPHYSVVREVGTRLRDTGAVGSCVELNAFRCSLSIPSIHSGR